MFLFSLSSKSKLLRQEKHVCFLSSTNYIFIENKDGFVLFCLILSGRFTPFFSVHQKTDFLMMWLKKRALP